MEHRHLGGNVTHYEASNWVQSYNDLTIKDVTKRSDHITIYRILDSKTASFCVYQFFIVAKHISIAF